MQDKQFIIEKLLEGHRPSIPSSKQDTPSGIEDKVLQCSIDNGGQSFKQSVQLTKTNVTKAAIETEHPMKLNQEKGPAKSKINSDEVHSKQLDKNKENGSKQDIMKKRKRITIVGYSMLNGIMDEGLRKDHNVQVKRHPGATSRDIMDYVRPIIRKKPDCIIIHAGTNDLTSRDKIDMLNNYSEIIEQAKNDSPGTSIVLSTIVTRKDKQFIEKKVSVSALNSEIKRFANTRKISVIDNSNLDVSCLSRKKLHLNEKGNSYLARNFLNFIKNF